MNLTPSSLCESHPFDIARERSRWVLIYHKRSTLHVRAGASLLDFRRYPQRPAAGAALKAEFTHQTYW